VSHVATPGEIRDWHQDLAPLAEDRIEPVIGLLSEVVGECSTCELPIRRCDPRRLQGNALHHLACVPAHKPERPTLVAVPDPDPGGPP